MAFAPALRKLTFTTHVTSSVAWVGAALVFLALAAIGLFSQNETTVRGAYLVMAPAAWFVLVPLAHVSLISGIALSLGTRWGLIRHYWVALKLAITLFCTIILLVYMGTFQQMARVADDPVASLGIVRNPSPVVHSGLALILLMAATLLAVYKPFGMTPYGDRQLGRVHTPCAIPSATTAGVMGPRTRNGELALWLVGLTVLALIVVFHLMGSWTHGH